MSLRRLPLRGLVPQFALLCTVAVARAPMDEENIHVGLVLPFTLPPDITDPSLIANRDAVIAQTILSYLDFGKQMNPPMRKFYMGCFSRDCPGFNDSQLIPPSLPVPNPHPDLFKLKLHFGDTKSIPTRGARIAIEFAYGNEAAGVYPMNAVIGALQDSVTMAVGNILTLEKVNQVNFYSLIEDLRVKTDYPYLFRTASSNRVVGIEVWDYIVYFQWRGAHVIYEETHLFGIESRSGLADAAGAAGRNGHLYYTAVNEASAVAVAGSTAQHIKTTQHRLIVSLIYNDYIYGMPMRHVWNEAGLRSPDYQFLGTVVVVASVVFEAQMVNHTYWHGITLSQDFGSQSVATMLTTWAHLTPQDMFDLIPEMTARWDVPYDLSTTTFTPDYFLSPPQFVVTILEHHAAFSILVNAFNDMLHDGFRPPQIQGDELKEYIKNVSFNGFGKQYGFNEFQDTSSPSLLVYFDKATSERPNIVPWGIRNPVTALTGVVYPLPGALAPIWATGERSWTVPVELSGCSPGYKLVKTDADDLGTCEPCPGGTYSDTYNADTCTVCDGGTASMPGSTECMNCNPGYFASRGAIECTSCFAGSVAALPGMSACTDCQVGEFQNVSAETECLKCPPGSHAASARSDSCTLCVPGTSAAQWGQQWCDECLPGSYQDESGASGCMACQAGSFSLDYAAGACIMCQVGYFQPNSSSSQGCDRCPIGTYAEGTGSSTCIQCSFGTTRVLGADSPSLCTCPAGTFLYETGAAAAASSSSSSNASSQGPPLDRECVPCNEYMEDCPGGDSPAMQKSGYQVSEDGQKVYLCVSEDACPGGLIGTCPTGSSGSGCATCEEGTYYWDGSKCAECNEAQGFIIAVFPFVIIVGFLCTYRFGNDPIGQSLSEISEFIVLAGLSLSVLFFFSSFTGFDVDWKEPVKTMMSISRVLQTELTNVNVTCSMSMGPAASLALTSSIPGIIALACLAWGCHDRSKAKKLFNTLASIVYAVFLPLLLHALKPFRYIVHPMGSGKSLLYLPSVAEGSSEHSQLMVVGVCVVLVYVVPFATACVVASFLMRRSKFTWRRRWYLVTFRFLFYKFHRNAFYWGCAILFRNTAFGLAPSMFPEHPSVGLFFLSAVAIVSAVHTGVVCPWRARWMNYVDISILVYVALVLNLATGWVRTDANSEGALATFLAVVACVGVAAAVFFVVRLLLQIACAGKQKREEMRQAARQRQSAILKDMGSFCSLEDQNLEVANALENLHDDTPVQEEGNKWASGIPPALDWVAQQPFDLKEVAHMVKHMRDKDYTLASFHEDCMNAFPELLLYNASKEGIPEKEGGRRDSNSGNGEQEQLRTFGALFSIYWICRLDIDGKQGLSFGVQDSNRHKVVEVPKDIDQKEVKSMNWGKMNPEQRRSNFYWHFEWRLLSDLFHQAGILVRDGKGALRLDTRPDGKLVAMLCLTAFHDIMKNTGLCPTVTGSPYGDYKVGETINDHDMALAYILDRYPNALPSFKALTADQRRIVRFTQSEMGFNAGWLVQAEGPPSAVLSRLKKAIVAGSAKDQDVAFYFAHWVTDLAGAEPTPFKGTEKLAVKFPPHVLQGLLSCFATVKALADKSETEVYEEYLVDRWKQVSETFGPVPTGTGRIAKMRLLCMGQHAAKQLLDAWEIIPAKDKTALEKELAETGLEGQRFTEWSSDHGPGVGTPFLTYYGPAWCQRVGQQYPELCLKVLATVFRQGRIAYPESVTEGSNEHGHRTIQVGCLKTIGVDDLKDVYDEISDGCMEVRKSNAIEGELKIHVLAA